MSSAMTSEYTLEIDIRDNTKYAIRGLERDLKDLGEKTAKASNDSFHAANNAAQSMIQQIHKFATDSSLDSVAVVKAFERQSQKTMDILQTAYLGQKDKADALQKEYDGIQAEVNKLNAQMAQARTEDREGIRSQLNQELTRLNVKQRELEAVQSYINQNKRIRADLKQAAVQVKIKAAETKKRADVEKQRAKYEELIAKRKASINKAEQKALDEEIKRQKAYICAIEQGIKAQQRSLKQQNAITAAIQNSEKAESRFTRLREKASKVLQTTYNAAGLVGGAGRMLSGGIHAASSGMAMISDASNRALERERAAGRVKGVDADTASKLIGDVYVKTGADTDKIVDAINRVRGLLGNLDNSELVQAASLELRYPGMSVALASVNDPVKKDDMLVYANKMKAIQAATGASDEQLATSTQAFANRKDIVKSGGSTSDYQAVYLAMQNSGAFDTEEELERVFKQFVRKQRASKKSVFEFAKDFKMEKYARGERNKLQAKNADANMKWDDLATAASTNSTSTPAQTTAEKNAERIRNLEERKNQMMIKLIDIVEPIVNELNKVLDSDKIKRLVDGLVKFITDVMPILANVILKIAEKLGMAIDAVEAAVRQNEIQTQRQVDAAKSRSTSAMLASRSGFDRAGQFANGGIAWGTSIVGERGPEAIIPLDYSRTARAGNIVQNVAQTFNMSGNETTALSLAQAVSSRDFTRAMGKAAFKAGRLGAF